MGRKTIILCEGVHDLTLISLILGRQKKTFWAKKWEDIEEYSHNTPPETTVISEFMGRKGQGISFLIKQDQDVDFCIESFWSLYENYNGYDLKLIIDSDGESSIRKIKQMMNGKIRRDVLQQSESCPNFLCFKNSERKPAVFLYPRIDERETGKLTELVKDAGCGNLKGCRNEDKRTEMLKDYLKMSHEWLTDVETFIME
ncbi:MAG: hypothetical protein PHF34_08835 [Bacteroidales bacterium]|jgi:hypothetical protein|nr:hypothetical protein [Bacteroidales bacterium]